MSFFKKKRTLFVHILMMTVIPVSIVFLIVIMSVESILSTSVTNHTKEIVRLTAAQISEHATIRLQGLEVLQRNISLNFANLDSTAAFAEARVEELLHTPLEMSPDVYASWLILEPGAFHGYENERYWKEYVRVLGSDDEYQEIFTLSEVVLDEVPWYQNPLRDGRVYFDAYDEYDYGTGEGWVNIMSIIQPIERDGVIIGCVGMDIRYEQLLRLENSITNDLPQKIMVIYSDGTVLFSFDTNDIGRNIRDYGFDGEFITALQSNEMWLDEIQSPFFSAQSLAILYPFNISNMDGTVFLYRGVSRDSLYTKFQTSIEVVYAAGVLGAMLVAFFIFISTRKVTSHAKRIAEDFQLVAEGGLDELLDYDSIQTTSANIKELDVLQVALATIVINIGEAHALRLKSIEAELENEKLVAASQAKTAFFATMSHEIRTPMNAVVGIAEIALLEGGLSLKQEKHIHDIKNASTALLTVINDIMDVSRLETGKMSLHYELYDFEEMIDNVAALTARLTAESNLKFELEIKSELPKCLYGDGARVRQVLLNLLGNAVKYTKQGFVALHVSMRDNMLLFDIIDSGIGLKAIDLSSIFDSFKRVDTRANRKITGTGLGLSICHNLVDIMGGEITVTSEYGVGSKFSVTLPVVLGDESELQHVEVIEVMRFTDDIRVLVVDDNEVNLNVSTGMLKVLYDINCDTAASGKEAIDMVQQSDYDIVFMDHMMPEMDGADTTRHIRALGGKFATLPIIALTANAVIGAQAEMLASGMDGFLAKPIQQLEIQEILCKWIPLEKRLVVSTKNPGRTAVPLREIYDGNSLITLGDPRLLALTNIREINFTKGLTNIGFDETMYIQSIKLLAQKIPQTVLALHDSIEVTNLKDFMVYIHGIKGSLLSVGEEVLSSLAMELEVAASDGDAVTCTEYLPDFLYRLEAFYERLEEALLIGEAAPRARMESTAEFADSEAAESSAPATASPKPPPREGTDADLISLREALEQFDFDRISAELAATSAMNWGERIVIVEQVRELVDVFEYSGAAELLSTIV